MIKAKELRIGNWILANGKIEEMNCISKQYPFINSIEYGVGALDWKDIEPIPLTEELVHRLGYENLSLKDSFYHRSQKTGKYDSSIYMGMSKGNEGKFFADLNEVKEIKYLHQLQNHYYYDVLTGEELTMKEL